MTQVITWQIVDGVAMVLPDDQRVTFPSNLDTSKPVYEAPQNAHRDAADADSQDLHVPRVYPPHRGNPLNRRMGLASARLPALR